MGLDTFLNTHDAARSSLVCSGDSFYRPACLGLVRFMFATPSSESGLVGQRCAALSVTSIPFCTIALNLLQARSTTIG